MIEAEMVSTPEGCTNNILITPNTYLSNKNTSAEKLLCRFIDTLDVKHNNSVCSFGTAKANCKPIKKPMRCGHIFQITMVIRNKPKGQRGTLILDSTSFSGCVISNHKLLSLCIY